MGADLSKEIKIKEIKRTSAKEGNICGSNVGFPNVLIKNRDICSWSLLHQCTVDNWKHGHAQAANFPDSVLSCDRTLHKDCSAAFCMSRQGIINIDRSTSVFSFKRRTKFAKMAEHFEYNHIPAQMSSVNHFRVKSVLCFRDSLVVLNLARNGNSQFGLLDLESNKFLGVFGKQPFEYENENFLGELSPDKSKCLVLQPRLFRPHNSNPPNDLGNYSQIIRVHRDSPSIHASPTFTGQPSNAPNYSLPHEEEGYGMEDVPLAELLLYDMFSKHLLSRIPLKNAMCHFSFDPRHNWCRIATTNIGQTNGENCLSLVELMTPSVPLKNLISFSTSDTCGMSANTNNGPSKNQKSTEHHTQVKSSISDWTWNITYMNHGLTDHFEEDNINFVNTIRRLSSSSSTSSFDSLSDLQTWQKLVDLRHSRDGRILVATMLELGECRCREKKTDGEDGRMFGGVGAARRLHQIHPRHSRAQRHCSSLPAVNCSLYIFDADTAKALHCIQYNRYACQMHTCPTNYVPVFSACGTRMAIATDVLTNVPGSSNNAMSSPISDYLSFAEHSTQSQWRRSRNSTTHHVQVYQLPSPAFCLQGLCRAVILVSRLPILELTLPPKIINYLKFGPEFD